MCFICSCKYVFHEGVDKFGRPADKGQISYNRNSNLLHRILTAHDTESWKYNLGAKFYKDRFGKATATAPDLQPGSWEWKRKVVCTECDEEILCCPGDVVRTNHYRHENEYVCSRCHIPICSECLHLSKSDRKIPQALANDNFIGYAHRCLVDEGVTWLEATIAGPVFSGLVTYYIAGKNSERHHTMESAVGKPERA